MSKSVSRQFSDRPGNGLLARLFLPLECLGCGAEGDWICLACQKEFQLSRPTVCVLCGKAGEDGLCETCRQSTGLGGVVSLLPYYYLPVQRLIRAVKFAGQFDGLSFFTHRYGRKILARIPEGDWSLAPIPLSKERQRQRGFNQAELFARQLSTLGQLPLWHGLIRTRHTAAQAELAAKERAKNMRGALTVNERPAPENVILVDDVMTTGSTIREAVRALKKAGSSSVWAITIAHG